MTRGMMSQAQYDLLENKFNELQNYTLNNETDLSLFVDDLKLFQSSNYAQTPAHLRINEDIQYLIKLMEIRLERYKLDEAIDLTINPDPDFSDDAKPIETPINLEVSGRYLTWDEVTHALRYEVSVTENNQTKTFFVQNNQFDLLNIEMGTYSFRIRAIGDGFFNLNSPYSTSLEHTIEAIELDIPSQVRVQNEVVRFDAVDFALGYEIMINQTEFFTTTNQFDLKPFNLPAGTYVIFVKAIGNQGAILDSPFSESYTYIVPKILNENEQVIYDLIRDELKTFIFYFMNRE
jgi:hypothetical protein